MMQHHQRAGQAATLLGAISSYSTTQWRKDAQQQTCGNDDSSTTTMLKDNSGGAPREIATLMHYPLQPTPELNKMALCSVPLTAAAAVIQDSVILESGTVDSDDCTPPTLIVNTATEQTPDRMDTTEPQPPPLPELLSDAQSFVHCYPSPATSNSSNEQCISIDALERLRQRILTEGYGKCLEDPTYIQLRKLCRESTHAYTRKLSTASAENFSALVPWTRLASARVSVLATADENGCKMCAFCAQQRAINARLVLDVPAHGVCKAQMCDLCAQMYHALWIVQCPEAALASLDIVRVMLAISAVNQ